MKDNLTFEEAVKRLEEIIQKLGTGDIPLESSLELYAESAELMAFCQKTLESAKLTVEEVFPETKAEE